MAGKRGMKRQRSYGLRSRAWWIIRKNKTVTLADLLMVLNDGSRKHADRNLGQYLTFLTRVGVLSRERLDDGKPTSNGVYQYRLVNDLGAKNPIMRKDGVFDANSKTLLPFVVESCEVLKTSQVLNRCDVGDELRAAEVCDESA
jgi:hypothetical protein